VGVGSGLGISVGVAEGRGVVGLGVIGILLFRLVGAAVLNEEGFLVVAEGPKRYIAPLYVAEAWYAVTSNMLLLRATRELPKYDTSAGVP